MNPYIQYQLAVTRVADMRSQAEHHRIARAVRRGRYAQQPRFPQAIPAPRAVRHHVLSALLSTYRQRPQPGTDAARVPEGLRI
jgi:hypothetical protein